MLFKNPLFGPNCVVGDQEEDGTMKIRTYIIFIVVLLSGCFVYNSWAKEEVVTTIPDQAIRLRILANSDQVEDQWLKRKVRDAIVQEISTWNQSPTNIVEAREMITEKLPKFQQVAEQTLAKHGSTDIVKVDFGQVPFPTKLYGEQVYPAGNYEALRVTIGKGKGDNWWCVLFPPLCFIDMSNGDAVTPQSQEQVLSASLANPNPMSPKPDSQPLQVRFFLLDKGMELLEKGF